MLNGNVIEEVQSFGFLGSIINNKGDCSQEIRRRLAIARNVVQSMTKIWKGRLLVGLKVRLIKSTAFAVATYGSESWTLKKNDNNMIDAFGADEELKKNDNNMIDAFGADEES